MHSEKCDPRQGCEPGCDVDEFLQGLEAPLLSFEVKADRRTRVRLEALKRGEILAS